MALPFRSSAGGSGDKTAMAPIVTSAHHHRSTTKVDHKPFKSRFTSKSALKDRAKGKTEAKRPEKGERKTPHQQVMSKLARRNQAKQLRMNHKDKREGEDHIFQAADGAAKHIAVVPLSSDVDAYEAINTLNTSVDVPLFEKTSGTVPVRVDRFRRNLLYLPAKFDLLQALDVCKLADWVVFILDAGQTYGEEEDLFLKSLEGQGITNVTAVVVNLDKTVPAPKRMRHLTDMNITFGHYFPALDKLSSLDSKADCSNLVRRLCTASTRGIRWRDDRSWMLVENVNWGQQTDGATSTTVTLSGTIRGKALNINRLVHLPGWGDFQISSVRQLPRLGQKRKADEMDSDEPVKEWKPTVNQDDLAELAPEIADMQDVASTAGTTEHKGVLLDDHHYFSDDNSHIPPTPKKLPAGTSTYQAAWYLDDVSDSDSDILDEEDRDGDIAMDAEADPASSEGMVLTNAEDGGMTEAQPSEYPASEMNIDEAPLEADEEARQLEEFRTSRKQHAEEDLEFPDEIELHPDVLARERLAKYRGLKSLRTSEWNHAEDVPYEPLEYKRLLQVPEYKKSYNSVLKETLAGDVLAGTKVEIDLLNVPISLQSTALHPSSMFSLLRHEHKQAVINLNVTLHSDLEEPIKAKDELIVQIGHRRLIINPVFSAAGNTPNDVHKSDRFLHPGRTAIATFTGPMTWGSVPVLVFRRQSPSTTSSDDTAPALIDATSTTTPSLRLIGTATTLPPSSTRVIAKRIILTGHPYKIHKKLVTIRYMFFNREDVLWFAALPLFTRRGRQGFVKEPLGTHGYFKATFDGKVNPLDAVGVSLYKRVWPRPARVWEG
ncbi:ribosome biogenesis protein tsr1 [Cladophialophora chaetospira]|uniref:Ribosome biogenesis protein tsr1 n=1 Tax=Cladophialophora chaetospira TaxID=386627 RepID=A0AA38XJM3_9EURO|nr:ribosome biogenesis protein tsr1 [Cladophialophora chaetospira]